MAIEAKKGEQTMGRASTQAKRRWNDKTYKRLSLYLRKEEDKAYLEYIQKRRDKGDSLADIVKEGLDYLMKEHNYRTF